MYPASVAWFDGMLGSMCLVGSTLRFLSLLGLACSNLADVAFQLIIGMLICCFRRHHRLLLLLGGIWYPQFPFCVHMKNLAFESKNDLTLIRPCENPPPLMKQLHLVADLPLEEQHLLQLLAQKLVLEHHL